MDEKLLKDSKFLSDVQQAALSHRDDAIPDKRPDLYQSMMWVKGTVDVLKARGFKIERKKDAT